MSSSEGDAAGRTAEVADLHELIALRARLNRSLLAFAERTLGISDEQELSGLVLECALELTRSDRALLTDVKEGVVTITAGLGKDQALVGLRVAAGEPIVYDTLKAAEVMVVEDTDSIPADTLVGRIARTHQTRAFALVAMRTHGVPVGQLFVGSGVPIHFEAEEIEALRLLSSMAAGRLARARVQKELEARRRRLDLLLEHLPIAIAVVGRNGAMVHTNGTWRSFAAQVQAPEGDLDAALSGIRLLHPDGRPIDSGDLLARRAFLGESPPPRESILEAADGRRFNVLSVAAPLTDEDGAIREVVMAFQDVSPLRALADAKDRFLRIASHELRSPLASLRATIELMTLDGSQLDDAARRSTLVARILRQTDRLTHLVEQLLDGARLNAAELPLHLEEADLVQLCRRAIEQLPAERSGHIVRLEAAGPIEGRWDPPRLEQVLTNLLTNALRYSPPGSSIEVRVRGEAERVSVAVIDHGIGIPPEQVGNLFTPFYRASNAHQMSRSGIGLGLHITSEIVRRHGGTVRVESELGRGSMFTVELPRRVLTAG